MAVDSSVVRPLVHDELSWHVGTRKIIHFDWNFRFRKQKRFGVHHRYPGTPMYGNLVRSACRLVRQKTCTASCWDSGKVICHTSKDPHVQSVTGDRIAVSNISWIISLTLWSYGFKWDGKKTNQKTYPPTAPVIPWPPLASKVDKGIGHASMRNAEFGRLIFLTVSGTIVVAFNPRRCVIIYTHIVYNHMKIHIVSYYIPVSVHSCIDGIYLVYCTYIAWNRLLPHRLQARA